MMMKKAISFLLFLSSSSLVFGAESSVRGTAEKKDEKAPVISQISEEEMEQIFRDMEARKKDEKAPVISQISEEEMEQIFRDMEARKKELEGVPPPTLAELLNATVDEEKSDRDLQWSVNRNPTIAQLARTTPQLSTLNGLIEYCGLDTFLGQRQNSLTVFAPRNHAFTLLDQTIVTQLVNSREICNILLYHMMYGELSTNSYYWRFSGPWLTLHGTALSTDTVITPGHRKINRVNGYSRVHQGNIRAANGLVHIIRQVLTPYPLPTPPPATTPPATPAPTPPTPVNPIEPVPENLPTSRRRNDFP